MNVQTLQASVAADPGWQFTAAGSQLAGSPPPAEDDGRQLRHGYLVRGFGLLTLLIRSDTVGEVFTGQRLYSIPNAPWWVMGMINARGNVVPVFDLQGLFGGEREIAKKWLLVLDKAKNAVGFFIEEPPQTLYMERSDLPLPALPSLLQQYVSMGCSALGKTWLEFDHNGFFSGLTENLGLVQPSAAGAERQKHSP
ncbi:MAG: chemotaxis protein CheW [Chromatiales bacterium]